MVITQKMIDDAQDMAKTIGIKVEIKKDGVGTGVVVDSAGNVDTTKRKNGVVLSNLNIKGDFTL